MAWLGLGLEQGSLKKPCPGLAGRDTVAIAVYFCPHSKVYLLFMTKAETVWWWEGQLLEPAESHGPDGTSTWAESKCFLVPWKVVTTALGTVMPWWGPVGVGAGSDAKHLKERG